MTILKQNSYEAVIVGSGPNGLAAAVTLARAGICTLLLEGKSSIGGGTRSAELTLPGFNHDICSAIHPLGISSPFFCSLPLSKYGLEWIQPPSPLAHPFDDGSAALLERSIEDTASFLLKDAAAYKRLMTPLANNWNKLSKDLLGPLKLPSHPMLSGRFAWLALRSAEGLARRYFHTNQAKALFAGLAAHSTLPLNKTATSSFGLILGCLGHVAGWPIAQGGSQSIANALASYFQSLGGEIATDFEVQSLADLPPARAVLFDLGPKQLLKIAGDKLPSGYRSTLGKYRYGPGVFKIDWALERPIPWKARECRQAGTLHLGGSLDEIAKGEMQIWQGKLPEKPFVLAAQQSLFDPQRAPPGKQTAWAYCHVPHGSTVDMTTAIEAQIERFAPGFKDCILARHTMSPADFESYNPNYVGGDIGGGAADLCQLFARPALRLSPYTTPLKGVFLCSSSTPPGGGVHGMCGFHAAQAALKQCF